jgi:O-antigen ligase
MRRIAGALLLIFVFAIPWEYSLDLGEPLGNVARVAGLLVLLAAVPAVFQAGRIRTPDAFCWFTLALYLWFCCTAFWTIDSAATLTRLRAQFQEFMIVWLVWEFTDTPGDLRNLLRATVAGSWVLALLTLAAFRSQEAIAAGQIRFAAYGQDPNDVARFLDLGFPPAVLLLNCERRWPMRAMAIGFVPVGVVAVLLTASRSGFLAALVALAGSLIVFFRGHARRAVAAAFALPPFLAALWLLIPSGTYARLATIPQQLEGGDWNQRMNIWSAGWRAFAHAPLAGTGAGTFVAAAHTAPIDSAHNTFLSVAVSGGLWALLLLSVLAVLAARAALRTSGPLRLALATCLLVLTIASFVATIEENRMTWLLFAIAIAAARLSEEDAPGLAACFQFAPLRPSAQSTKFFNSARGGVTSHVTL